MLHIQFPEIDDLEQDEVLILAICLGSEARQSMIDISELTDDEIERAERFHFIMDKNRYIAGRTLARKTIRSILKTDSELIFKEGRNKKPELSVTPSTQFNISHSGDWVVVALTWNAPLGIDVEKLDTAKDFEGLGRRVMTDSEYAQFLDKKTKQQSELFYSLWVRKEAVLKCMGTGFSLDPRSIEVGHNKQSSREFIQKNNPIRIIELQQHLPMTGHKSALAYEQTGETKNIIVQYCTLLDSR